MRITLKQPRRIVVDKAGNQYIADSGANKIFRISHAGEVTTFADKLNEPSGLLRDAVGNLYISNHAHGVKDAGSLVRISKDGKRTVVVSALTGPKGLAMNAQGTLFLALFNENRIVAIDPDGRVMDFARGVESPAALAFDRKGNLLAVNSTSGTVSRISPKGKASIVASGLSAPSDIAIGPDGLPVVTNYAGTQLTRIMANGKTEPYLNVPRGTIGIAFNSQGNLVFVNWNLRMAVKITTRLSIPCPHCKKSIPVRIRPRIKPPKKTKPVI